MFNIFSPQPPSQRPFFCWHLDSDEKTLYIEWIYTFSRIGLWFERNWTDSSWTFVDCSTKPVVLAEGHLFSILDMLRLLRHFRRFLKNRAQFKKQNPFETLF